MSAAKNPAIGSVPCPMPGCSVVCEVKKFAHRATRDTGKRVAGRLYFDCSTHGRFGFDGRQAMQDYILEKGTIWGEAAKGAPASEPAEKPEAPAPSAAQQPAAKPQPAAPTKPTPAKSSGWGFFR